MPKISSRLILLFGSPMCTWFSTSQQTNKGEIDPVVRDRERARAVFHSAFVFSSCTVNVMNRYPNNFQTVTDQCMFCSKTPVPKAQGEDSAKTPPRWLTNSGCIAQALSAWCDGAQKHQQCGGHREISCRGFNVTRTRYVTIMKEMSQQMQSYLCVNAGNGEDPCRVGSRR